MAPDSHTLFDVLWNSVSTQVMDGGWVPTFAIIFFALVAVFFSVLFYPTPDPEPRARL